MRNALIRMVCHKRQRLDERFMTIWNAWNALSLYIFIFFIFFTLKIIKKVEYNSNFSVPSVPKEHFCVHQRPIWNALNALFLYIFIFSIFFTFKITKKVEYNSNFGVPSVPSVPKTYRNSNHMKESDLVRSILRYLKTVPGCFCWKEHGGMYGTAGIPDIICCINGRFVAFEAKVPGNVPTKLQDLTIRKIRNSGGIAAVVYSLEEVKASVDEVLGGNA